MESRQDTFQSTPSAWRETHGILFCGNCGHHFNPLPPHGGRHYNREELIFLETFQSTPSAWRETTASSPKSSHMVPFQSTPSAWRETQSSAWSALARSFQSTPSAWRETPCIHFPVGRYPFQSTPSAGRETRKRRRNRRS